MADVFAPRDLDTANDSSRSHERLVSINCLHFGLQQLLAAVNATTNDALKLHPVFQALATSFVLDGKQDHHAAVHTQLQALALCLTHAELRVLVVKYLRPFVLDLIVRLTDPVFSLKTHQQDNEWNDSMQQSELLAMTLSELLIYLPSTSTLVQQYFETAPCFFAFADIVVAQRQQSDKTIDRLRRIAKTAFQLLRAKPTELKTLWNWTSFLSLSFHDDVLVQWYAARATAVVLTMSNAQRNAFLNGLNIGDDAAVCGSSRVRQIELDLHSEDVTRQEQLVDVSVYHPQIDDPVVDPQAVPFHDLLQNIHGVVIPTSKRHRDWDRSNTSFVASEALIPTPSTQRNLRSLAIALGLNRPVLVAGPGGCGKTAMIRDLARRFGTHDLVELHLDDQIDSKTLLGSYVCTDVPGEFTWQPGALTTAVLTGRWVVIEDIGRAPFEVLAALMPLLEMREMVLPGRAESLVAHWNFQIFGTTTHAHEMPKGFQESVWTKVGVAPLANCEIEQIIVARFPRIERHVVSKIMSTYDAVSGTASKGMGSAAQFWKETRRNYGREFGLRDVLKWCKRIYRFSAMATEPTSEKVLAGQEYITEDERMRIVIEALDVFCAGIRDTRTRLHSACALAAIWDVPSAKTASYLEQHKPHVTFTTHEVVFGRVHLPTLSQHAQLQPTTQQSSRSVVMTGHVLRLLEKIAAIVATCEPALLIGETGCGKTTIIQHMAVAMGQHLVVQNLNIQSDSSDLVGGFKPVEIHLLARPLYMEFVDLFTATFSPKSNADFLNVVRIALEHKNWRKLVRGLQKAIEMAETKLQGRRADRDSTDSSRNVTCKMITVCSSSTSALVKRWDAFGAELVRFERQKAQAESHFAFSFVEGALVKALRKGHWVLLDEINLASSDTLERISTLLEHETSAFSLTERGDVEIIRPHPNFRLFGAMNPSTDVGKKDLPPSLRNRFTEIYVDECVNVLDLQMVVHHQFKEISGALVPETVTFYLEARKQAEVRLSDGARHKPRYSLRTLSQALHITRILIQRGYGTSRAMFEGFCSSFCTQLEMESRQYLETLIKNTFAKTIKPKELKRSPPCPGGPKRTNEFMLVSSYWLEKGDFQAPFDESLPDPVTSRRKFVLTKSVEENLRHVARAVVIGRYPVLLQGPTSAGKTSLIRYLAARIGQKCVRINNHEHTDIQEYLGSYVSESTGKLTFQEGVLVEAVRKGWWIILDELNLAPSEVLEALNRLLDDNRELFLPETQETITPHPKFMLFATQNPPGLYGGRKVLSRAFRNRFLEIQIDEVAASELQTILQERSSLPPSYCGILVDIMRQLQLIRQQSSIFAGKSGFITTRDLLRWAERRPATKQALADEGYCLLAERLRKDEEKELVKKVLETKCNVTIDLEALYYSGKPRESNLLDEHGKVEHETVWGTTEHFERVQTKVNQAAQIAATGKGTLGNATGLDNISVTKSLRRLFSLVGRCLQNAEPVLLVGETGCGKTTVCQLYSLLFSQHLHILNCHQHTETSDFLGCLRPVRGKENIVHQLKESLARLLAMSNGCIGEREIAQRQAEATSLSVGAMLVEYEKVRHGMIEGPSASLKKLVEEIDGLTRRYQSIFEWADGPLVESMKKGELILIDEINLAEDAVLERLNSVLEPSRTLLLAEKGGDEVEELVAHPKWRVMATMNPGGDFGKRELSPALRNRFTEIWVPAISDLDDMATIIRDRLVGVGSSQLPRHTLLPSPHDHLSGLCDPMLKFVMTFNAKNRLKGCGTVTLRDILSWINFITSVVKKEKVESAMKATAWTAFVQGAALSILDGLSLGSDKALHTALQAREEAYRYILALVSDDDPFVKQQVIDSLKVTTLADGKSMDELNWCDSSEPANEEFGISPFLIPRGPDPIRRKPAFSLKAPTTLSNLYRVLRAMQVNRPIILEGSPGVGKTSLISALAAASGHHLVRINLSEQTDISDLFGSDLPAASSLTSNAEDPNDIALHSGSSSAMFEWCDGVFLRALKSGHWVLLDELNLASQSVLEGLNSCLDHRGSVYIPELDKEFKCPRTFRVFAAQNPLRQGGGRKGLPKSFLNRFTRVFVETLHEQDLMHIASSMYPSLHCAVAEAGSSDSNSAGLTFLERIVGFNRAVHDDTMVHCNYGRQGAPWEFNLRDVFRVCDLLKQQILALDTAERTSHALSYYVNFIYVDRMRCTRDRELLCHRFQEFFGLKPTDRTAISFRMSAGFIEIGNAVLARQQIMPLCRVAPPLFNFLLKPMEALVHCVNMSWPALLVGPSASGKTASVRLLAALSGNTLHELGMSAGTDATELLGCFEQVDPGRKLREVKQKIQVIYDHVLRHLMLSSASSKGSKRKESAIFKQIKQLSSAWWALTTREKLLSEKDSGKENAATKLFKSQLDAVMIDLMKHVVNMLMKIKHEGTMPELSCLLKDIDHIVKLSKSHALASCFDWFDGSLIKAMEKGDWVLLDNVNFCSSSVLDRLNSLMETGGEMLINECGIINGTLRVIKPHPNFRIFLAMDAQYGEVSRAMRNRCIEIALVDADASRLDLLKLSLTCGIPGLALSQAFQSAHERVLEKAKAVEGSSRYGRLTRRHLEHWSLLASAELARGVVPMTAITDAFQRVYGHALLAQLDLSRDVFNLFLLAFQRSNQNLHIQRILSPLALRSTFALCQQSEHFMLQQDVVYLEHLILSVQSSDLNGVDTLQLTWLTPSQSIDLGEGIDEGTAFDAWLDSISVRCKLHQTTSYSSMALTEACEHLSSRAFFRLDDVDNPLAMILAPFALHRIVKVSSMCENSTGTYRTIADGLRLALDKVARDAADNVRTLRSVELLARFLQSMTESESYTIVVRNLVESARQLATLLGSSAGLPLMPVHFAANDAAFRRLQSWVATHSATAVRTKGAVDHIWHSILIIQRQMDLFDGMEWYQFCEQEQYREVNAQFTSSTETCKRKRSQRTSCPAASTSLNKLSVLQQSYAVHEYHVDRSILDNELVFLIYPLLHAFDAFLSAFLEARSRLTMDPAFFEAVQAAIRDRFEFSLELRMHVFEFPHFLIHWQWLNKSLVRLAKLSEQHSLAWVTQWKNLLDMAERMQETIEKLCGCGLRKMVLWKKGGHSLLPSTAGLWQAEHLLTRLSKTWMHVHPTFFSPLSVGACRGAAEGRIDVLALLFGGVSSMEAAMKSGKLDVSPLFYVDIETRTEVLHALCALSYLAQKQFRVMHGRVPPSVRPRARMAEELVQLPSVLLTKLQAQQVKVTELMSKKTLYLCEIEDSAHSHVDLRCKEDCRIGKDAPILLFDSKDSAFFMERLVTFQLSPLFDHDVARQELRAITKLLHVLNLYRLWKNEWSLARCRDVVKAIVDVLTCMETIVAMLLRLGLRGPASYHAYQDLVWCGYNFRSLDCSGTLQTELEAEIERFSRVVQTHMNGMLYNFHQFLRCNSFNEIDSIALEIFDTRKKLQKAPKHNVAQRLDGTDHAQIVAGFPRLFQAVQSAVVLKHVAEVDLKASMCPTSEAQMRSARLDTIKAHFAKEPLDDGNTIVNGTISFLKELLAATVLAFESTFHTAVDQWQIVVSLLEQFVEKGPTFETKSQTQLLQALHRSSDSTFTTLVDTLVTPLLTALANATETHVTGDQRHLVFLGESMVMLGLWRFALLLPSSPVDPATKPLVRKETLLNRLAMVTMQDAANSSIHRLNPSPASSVATVERAAQSLSALHGQVMQVSASAIQRYQCHPKAHTDSDGTDPGTTRLQPVAASVFGDLFRDLLRFSTTMMPVDKLLALLIVARSTRSSLQRKQELVRELDMFQQTSESFLAQLSKKFGDCFRDMLEPIGATIYCVKEGIALVTWSLDQQIKDTSLTEQHKEALALSLVQFPSPICMPSMAQPWQGIQLILNTVGTPAIATLFGPGATTKRKSEVALLDVALAKVETLFCETLTSWRTNRAVVDSFAMDTALHSTKCLFDLFLAKWHEQMDRQEEKRKEEEALFQYKVRHVDLETEEELMEMEFCRQFPDYRRDFEGFLGPEQSLAGGTDGISGSAGDEDMLISETMLQRLCKTHTKLYAETANSNIVVSSGNILRSFTRAFSLAVKLRQSLNAMTSSALERAVASSGILAASLAQARLGFNVRALAPAVPSFQTLTSDYIRGIDFHRDPLVQEVVLVAEPLQNLLVKVQSLLTQWPDHAILQQIVLIADRIRNFEINSPLVRTLSGVELLLRKAQEWEMYAARAYAITDELRALSALVTRWRKLELYSWPHLLYVKEKQHRVAAQKTWINMYSLLTAQFESNDSVVDGAVASSTSDHRHHQWLHLNSLSTWLFTFPHEIRSSVQAFSEAVRASLDTQREFMTKLFEALDAYIRSCPIGQYETRLLVVYSFCAQSFMELSSVSAQQGSCMDSGHQSTKYALANMLYHLYRYYAQHLGYLERQWSGLKAPIQRKLVDFVNICRWDEQTYYSLAESAEKSHRKLMKFVRDYDAVLTRPMQTVLDGSTDSGITTEGGFVGVQMTRAELASLDDSVVVPVDGNLYEQREQEASVDGVPANDTMAAGNTLNHQEVEESERPTVLRLRHTSVPVRANLSADAVVLTQSLYVAKLPTLMLRIARYTNQHILSYNQVDGRQQVRAVCEDLCTTIFYRMAKLQTATRLPKGAKKKALIDLLSELKTQGLAHHRMQLPAQQQQMHRLFELDVPDVENCLRVDLRQAALDPYCVLAGSSARTVKGKKNKLSKKKDKHYVAPLEGQAEVPIKDSPIWLWQRADGYYYRFLGQLASLRYSAGTTVSHDLSSSETERMSGYAENMLFTMLQQRQILHATSLSHEKLVHGLTTLKVMKQFQTNYLEGNCTEEAVVDWKAAIKWQSFQQTAVAALRRSLRELEIATLQILQHLPESTAIVTHAQQQFQLIFERFDAIQQSFVDTTGATQSLGVPVIPHCVVHAREDAGSEAAMVALVRPAKRVYGISPLITPRRTFVQLPAAIAVLEANSVHLHAIQRHLCTLSSSVGTVTTLSCFDQFVADYACFVRSDTTFQQALAESSSELLAASDTINIESAQSLTAFTERYDTLVETVLVSIQELTKQSQEAPHQEQSKVPLVCDHLAMLSTLVKDSRVNHIASQLAELLAVLDQQYRKLAQTRSQAWQRVFVGALSMLERFEPSLLEVRAVSRQLLVDFLVAHKSVMKLDYVLVRIFRNLFHHGFCQAQESQDQDGQGSGTMQFQDDVEGTGMGEGEGKKDVSHEIEDEEQLLGLQGEPQDEPEPPADSTPADTGLEMQNDFEGTMQDVPEAANEENGSEDNEEELDREMGDFEQDDENVVDEKMWGDDSDDEEDNIDKENEKFENDSKVQGKALDDEVRGKDGDEEDKDDEKATKEENKRSPRDPLDDKNVGKDGDDETMEEVNDDSEEKYEDHHDVDPTERGEGPEVDDLDESHCDELPEDMQLDTEDGEADGNDVDDDVDKLDESEQEMEEEGANRDEVGKAEEEDAEAEEKEEEEEQLDHAVQLGGGGLEDEQEAAKEQEEDDVEPTEALEHLKEEPLASTVAGTQAKDGQDAMEVDEQEAEGQEEKSSGQDQEPSNDNSSSRGQHQHCSNDQDAKQEWKPQSQVDNMSDREREKRRNRREPNPYRNAQEAHEHWKKRVEMVDRTEDERELDNKTIADEQEKGTEMATAEFVDDDDDEMEDVEMALAAADENQIINQRRGEEEKQLEMEEEEERKVQTGEIAMEIDKVEDKEIEEVIEEKQQPKAAKQEPKPTLDAGKGSREKQEDPNLETRDQDVEDSTLLKEYDPLNDESEQALPTTVRDWDSNKSMQDQEREETTDSDVKLLSCDEVAAMRNELDAFIATWTLPSEHDRGTELWTKYTALTAGASHRLCEQLRLVLEPTLRAKLEGDFRTGKRINMRKVIPYIASQFRKDKIWLRRTRPSKRQYQVMLAIDDSESMADNHAGRLALEALATLCKAMTQLEVGELAVVKFGQDVELLHAFDLPFTDDAGSRVIGQFGFHQTKTNMVLTLDTILQLLEMAKQAASTARSSIEFTQIVFLISDGRFDSDGRVRIRKLIETALERQQLIVLLIVDQQAAETDRATNQQQTSILDTQSVTFEKGKVRMVPYLEKYPFPYYVLLPTSAMIPEILSDSLRQWFEMLQVKR